MASFCTPTLFFPFLSGKGARVQPFRWRGVTRVSWQSPIARRAALGCPCYAKAGLAERGLASRRDAPSCQDEVVMPQVATVFAPDTFSGPQRPRIALPPIGTRFSQAARAAASIASWVSGGRHARPGPVRWRLVQHPLNQQ